MEELKPRKWYQRIGPGIIIAATVFGPGSLTLATKMGAEFRYQLLWIIVIAAICMIAFTHMSGRAGIVTGKSLMDLFKQRWGKPTAVIAGIGLTIAGVSFQSGNTIGSAIAFSESFNTDVLPWIFVVSIVAISLLFFKSFYKIFEKVMIGLVGVMLLSFVVTLIYARPSIVEIIKGSLIPSVPDGSILFLAGLCATTFSVGGAFYQSYLVLENKNSVDEIKEVSKEGSFGIAMLGMLTGTIMICSAAILNPLGIEVNTATDMGKNLEPLFGSWAKYLFMLGLFGAAFSTLIGNAVVGATIFSDSISMGRDLKSKKVRVQIAIFITIGAILSVIFGKNPLQLIVLAQGVAIFVFPFVGIGVYLIANDKRILGKYKNNWLYKIVGLAGLLLLLGLAVANFKTLFL